MIFWALLFVTLGFTVLVAGVVTACGDSPPPKPPEVPTMRAVEGRKRRPVKLPPCPEPVGFRKPCRLAEPRQPEIPE